MTHSGHLRRQAFNLFAESGASVRRHRYAPHHGRNTPASADLAVGANAIDPRGSGRCCTSSSHQGLRRSLLHVASWHVGEEEAQSLGHGRVRKNGVAESRIGHACQHRRLHNRHDLACLRANHSEAKDSVVLRAY